MTLTTLVRKYSLQESILPRTSNNKVSGLLKRMRDLLETPFFGVEKSARQVIIDELVQDAYPIIDPSFLSMRHPDEFMEKAYSESGLTFGITVPRFAVYSLDSSECEAKVDLDLSGRDLEITESSILEPDLHEILKEPLVKAFKIVKKIVRKDRDGDFPFIPSDWLSYSFTSNFTGIIPNRTRSMISYVKSLFNNELYIVAEADNWEGRHVYAEDPLVIGIRNSNCFLLDEFNVSPLEHGITSKLMNELYQNGNK